MEKQTPSIPKTNSRKTTFNNKGKTRGNIRALPTKFPIDYLIFEGLDERDIKKIHLLEVKNEKSKLSKHQKQIKDIIEKLNTKEVTFKTFNFKNEP
jgi:predicted Holliday junction resolvase-like endonuclease